MGFEDKKGLSPQNLFYILQIQNILRAIEKRDYPIFMALKNSNGGSYNIKRAFESIENPTNLKPTEFFSILENEKKGVCLSFSEILDFLQKNTENLNINVQYVKASSKENYKFIRFFYAPIYF